MSKAEHLKAHASRLLATAERFRHRGHNACADQITSQANRYLEAAAALEAAGPDTARQPPAFVASVVQAFAPRTSAHGANGGARPS
jgi:hypothetical protein